MAHLCSGYLEKKLLQLQRTGPPLRCGYGSEEDEKYGFLPTPYKWRRNRRKLLPQQPQNRDAAPQEGQGSKATGLRDITISHQPCAKQSAANLHVEKHLPAEKRTAQELTKKTREPYTSTVASTAIANVASGVRRRPSYKRCLSLEFDTVADWESWSNCGEKSAKSSTENTTSQSVMQTVSNKRDDDFNNNKMKTTINNRSCVNAKTQTDISKHIVDIKRKDRAIPCDNRITKAHSNYLQMDKPAHSHRPRGGGFGQYPRSLQEVEALLSNATLQRPANVVMFVVRACVLHDNNGAPLQYRVHAGSLVSALYSVAPSKQAFLSNNTPFSNGSNSKPLSNGSNNKLLSNGRNNKPLSNGTRLTNVTSLSNHTSLTNSTSPNNPAPRTCVRLPSGLVGFVPRDALQPLGVKVKRDFAQQFPVSSCIDTYVDSDTLEAGKQTDTATQGAPLAKQDSFTLSSVNSSFASNVTMDNASDIAVQLDNSDNRSTASSFTSGGSHDSDECDVTFDTETLRWKSGGTLLLCEGSVASNTDRQDLLAYLQLIQLTDSTGRKYSPYKGKEFTPRGEQSGASSNERGKHAKFHGSRRSTNSSDSHKHLTPYASRPHFHKNKSHVDEQNVEEFKFDQNHVLPTTSQSLEEYKFDQSELVVENLACELRHVDKCERLSECPADSTSCSKERRLSASSILSRVTASSGYSSTSQSQRSGHSNEAARVARKHTAREGSVTENRTRASSVCQENMRNLRSRDQGRSVSPQHSDSPLGFADSADMCTIPLSSITYRPGLKGLAGAGGGVENIYQNMPDIEALLKQCHIDDGEPHHVLSTQSKQHNVFKQCLHGGEPHNVSSIQSQPHNVSPFQSQPRTESLTQSNDSGISPSNSLDNSPVELAYHAQTVNQEPALKQSSVSERRYTSTEGRCCHADVTVGLGCISDRCTPNASVSAQFGSSVSHRSSLDSQLHHNISDTSQDKLGSGNGNCFCGFRSCPGLEKCIDNLSSIRGTSNTSGTKSQSLSSESTVSSLTSYLPTPVSTRSHGPPSNARHRSCSARQHRTSTVLDFDQCDSCSDSQPRQQQHQNSTSTRSKQKKTQRQNKDTDINISSRTDLNPSGANQNPQSKTSETPGVSHCPDTVDCRGTDCQGIDLLRTIKSVERLGSAEDSGHSTSSSTSASSSDETTNEVRNETQNEAQNEFQKEAQNEYQNEAENENQNVVPSNNNNNKHMTSRAHSLPVCDSNNNASSKNAKSRFTPPQPLPNLPRLTAIFDYAACSVYDVTVCKQEVVTLVSAENADWLWVRKAGGQEGYVPATYVVNLEALDLDPHTKTTYF